MGYRRNKNNQMENNSILKIEGVTNRRSAEYYLGKRVAYIYRVKKTASNKQVGACNEWCSASGCACTNRRVLFLTSGSPRSLGPCHPLSRCHRCCPR